MTQMPLPRSLLLAFGAASLLSACGESSSSDDCPGDVVVTVGPGTTPTFSWAPACPAGYVAITQGGVLIWAIGWTATDVDRANAIESPITYPGPPAGVPLIIADAPAALSAGVPYAVYVWANGDDGGQVNMGTKGFTP